MEQVDQSLTVQDEAVRRQAGALRSLMTGLFLLVFLGVIYWADFFDAG